MSHLRKQLLLTVSLVLIFINLVHLPPTASADFIEAALVFPSKEQPVQPLEQLIARESFNNFPSPVISSTQTITAAPALIDLANRTSTRSPRPPARPLTSTVSIQALTCNPTGGTGGLSAGTHDTTIAGQPATVIVGQAYDPQKPAYLAFYLHGDEGGYDFHADSFNVINQFINDEGWIYVAPQAPEFEGGYPWYADGVGAGRTLIEDNAELLRDVLNDTFAKYNVCRNILFGASASGGSWFYDGYFYPNNGGQYPAFMNLNCGSSGINGNGTNVWTFYGYYQKLQALSQNQDILSRTELKYTVGANDFLYDNAVISADAYANLGFGIITHYLPNTAHCAYNLADEIKAYWQAKAEDLVSGDEEYQVYLPLIVK
jgi:hypothetical protein